MNHSGEAAEQVFRMTLDGAEVAIRLAGAGAKNLAVLLYTILSQQKKTKGRARLETMLRSGKELDVFNVKNSDMQMFVEKAKQYGILYCVMRDPKGSPDGITPVMVRVEDARRINDIVERFNFAVVNTATVRADIEKSRAEKAPAEPEKAVPDRDATDKVVDELFERPLQKEQALPENPTAAKTEKSLPSEPISEKPRNSAEGTTMQDETRVLEMDKYEYGVVFHSLNDKRNELLREQRSTDAVDEVLLKVIDAPTKKEKKNIDRGER